MEITILYLTEHEDHIDVLYLVDGKQHVKWIGHFSVFAALRAGNFKECERVLEAHLEQEI